MAERKGFDHMGGFWGKRTTWLGSAVGVICVCALTLQACSVGGASSTATKGTATATATATFIAISTTGPSPSPTKPAGTPTPTGFSTFRSTDGGYTIDFPSAWGTKPMTEQGVTAQVFGSADQADVFAVLPLTTAVVPANYASIVTGMVGADGLGGANVRVFPIPTTQTIGATTWTRLTATFDLAGAPNSLIAYVTPHGAGTIALIFFAPDASFVQVYNADFAPMTQSFAFLK